VSRSQEQLISAVSEANSFGVPWRVIGSSSNLLVADEGVDGLIVKTIGASRFGPLPSGRKEALVEAEAGSQLAALARQTALAGWEGLEWAANVPGTVGGAVVDNSGAFGSCISEHLVRAQVYIPRVGVSSLSPEDLGLAYRTSRLKRGELVGVVLAATFRLAAAPVETLRARLRDVQRLRRETQPAGFSIGSVFANPPEGFAGALIEGSGLKGARVGDAEVSSLHANFILNRRSARARDVVELMAIVQQRVKERTGVVLLPEIQLLGQFARELLELLSWADRTVQDPAL
jgi:UDP-N-acetylmuramate dehydrogenase